jgi:Xaa-Pro aminopeptidase
MIMTTIHDVHDNFELSKFLEARRLTMLAVEQISDLVEIGMQETDGAELIDTTLKNLGVDKKWHPNKFRIGSNTLKSFRDISQPNIKLQKNDIYFIDIGPVWNSHEGDYGNTFTVGNNPDHNKISNASRQIFSETAQFWKNEKKSGKKLYEFASLSAKKLGYELNNRMKGHRIGDFPHHLFYKGGMIDIDETPCNNLWILEIHIVDNEKKIGAFFEDILQN